MTIQEENQQNLARIRDRIKALVNLPELERVLTLSYIENIEDCNLEIAELRINFDYIQDYLEIFEELNNKVNTVTSNPDLVQEIMDNIINFNSVLADDIKHNIKTQRSFQARIQEIENLDSIIKDRLLSQLDSFMMITSDDRLLSQLDSLRMTTVSVADKEQIEDFISRMEEQDWLAEKFSHDEEGDQAKLMLYKTANEFSRDYLNRLIENARSLTGVVKEIESELLSGRGVLTPESVESDAMDSDKDGELSSKLVASPKKAPVSREGLRYRVSGKGSV